MVDCPMSRDPRDDHVLGALWWIVERNGAFQRVKAARIAIQCGTEPSDVGNHLARWAPVGIVDHGRHGWRFTKRGLTAMRASAEVR